MARRQRASKKEVMAPEAPHRRDPWIKSQIDKNISKKDPELYLAHPGLKEVPEEIRTMPWLERLDLRCSGVKTLPSWLGELPQLGGIDIRCSAVAKVPALPNLILDWELLQSQPGRIGDPGVIGVRIGGAHPALPAALLDMAHLKVLDLSSSKGEVHRDPKDTTAMISQAASALTELVEISLFNCGLTALPEVLSDFAALDGLIVAENPLVELPTFLSRLRTLTRVFVDSIGLTVIPDWLLELPRLRSLHASFNQLIVVPDHIYHLSKLERLALRDNLLRRLPPGLAKCSSLSSLNLANNPLHAFPLPLPFCLQELICTVYGGEHIWTETDETISGSKPMAEGTLQIIPIEILDLPQLQTLEIFNQPITTPPPEVVERGLDAIRDYWRQTRQAGTDHLCESKLILVGEPGAGKTTLVQKLLDPAYDLDAQQPSTEGIDVTRWAFPTLLRPRTAGIPPEPRDYAVNIWDFGGQEIYHATHQFFLTRRSLYVLLADSRKEDTDFHYWLSVVELLSDGSPVLIVKNEKQERKRELDEDGLRQRFGNLKEVLATNLATNRGLQLVAERIRHHLEGLPHIGEPLPATWRRVREALEGDPRDYVSVDVFLGICREHGFTRREDALLLSGFLHDLGICLHFQDDPVLKSTVILRPTWGTDAVYRALDDAQVIAARGHFVKADLARIWAEPTYDGKRDELLQLMIRFDLCYKLLEGEAWIAPQLLSASPPAYRWETKGELQVRYSYLFMPKGILTRLIVATHDLIEEGGTLVWRTGVVLGQEGARCEAIEDYPHRRITVRVTGPERKVLLGIVHREVDRIHRSFRRLDVQTLVPCACSLCESSEEPQLYPLKTLEKFSADRKDIQCQRSYEMMDAIALIDAVFERRSAPDGDGRGLTSWSASPTPRREVFISYAWKADTLIVDAVQNSLQESGVLVVRDKNELKYKDSIGAFMERLGRGSAVVVVLSAAYLRSKSCMYELLQIHKNRNLQLRAFPIVLADAEIYDAETVLDLIAWWEAKINRLDEKMKTVEQSNLQGIREDIDLFREIRAMIAGLTQVIRDMNTLTAVDHNTTDFKQLTGRIEAQLNR